MIILKNFIIQQIRWLRGLYLKPSPVLSKGVYMKYLKLTILLGLLYASNVAAEQTVLKCVSDTGVNISDLVIDIDTREMTWGKYIKYDIYHIDDTYISAYKRLSVDSIDGEVFIINRITGDYHRRLAEDYFDTEDTTMKNGTFMAHTFSGCCSKQQF